MLEQYKLLAAYNAWMNAKAYAAAATLPAPELHAERGAFFGSIFGTLHHLIVADRIWLGRFAAHPGQHKALAPVRAMPVVRTLDAVLATTIAELRAQPEELDAIISAFIAELSEADLRHVLHHSNTKGVTADRVFASLLLHFFNHQTHHRGQASTLLLQAGADIGVTDLLVLVPNEAAEGAA
jgi:uncharacterized damage-inducible protein DinB